MDGLDIDRISIGLLVTPPDGREHELEIEARPDTSLGEVAGALGERLAVPAPELFMFRTGSWIDPGETIATAGLLHGERIFLGPRSELPASEPTHRPAPDLGPRLIAVGGVNIGASWPLHGGSMSVGRGRDCDVAIDDPALSRTHLRLEIEGEDIWVIDAGSTNGTFSKGRRITGRHRWIPGEVIEAGASLLTIQAPGMAPPAPDIGSPAGRVLFNRPPRVSTAPPSYSFEVPSPPVNIRRPALPLAAAGVPILIALVLWRLFPENPALLVIMALSPVMALFSHVEERRRGKRGAHREETAWRSELSALVTEIASARESHATRLHSQTPDAAQLLRRAHERPVTLWERRRTDGDFLLSRVGWGDRTWPVEISHASGAKGPLRDEADKLLDPLRLTPSVPLAIDLRSSGVMGLCGDLPAVEAAARWLVLQLVTLHSPEDLVLTTLLAPDTGVSWRWMDWLPHTREYVRSAPSAVLEDLLTAIDLRRDPGSLSREHATVPAIVVLLDQRARLSRPQVTRLLREGPGAGIYPVWLGADREQLPGETGAIVEMKAGDEVEVTITRTGEVMRGAAEGVTENVSRELALALAPLLDASPSHAGAELPSRVPLLDLLGEAENPAERVVQNWASHAPGLVASIGISGSGALMLDLVADGPHALVAGTTGSGKSELLQTLVASVAWNHSPERVNFLLIDYKGGAAFKECVDLPHTVAMVTDLDPQLARRALVSLDAELKRRERILDDARVQDIAALERQGTERLPRLVLVVDEFAALIKELPAFVDGVVDLAQRGRSLGIHLVLATQRPAGVINDAIRANTDLRIALRVSDEPESEDVVGTREAAHIPRSLPGRALLRRGHGDVELFQAASSSAGARGAGKGIVVTDRASARGMLGSVDEKWADETQLHALAAIVREAVSIANTPLPRSPWLPPLPPELSLEDLRSDHGHVPGAFGLVDLPESQQHVVAAFRPGGDAGLLVYGTGGSGKTTLLRTLGASLASGLTTDELHLYGIDFGNGGLSSLRSLPHCGDVIAGDDHERIEECFAMLHREVELRKKAALGQTGSPADRVTLVVMLDGYEGFAAAFERVNMGELIDALPRLVSDGRSLGVHFVVTGERRAEVSARLAALLPMKVMLRMNDDDEYIALGLDASLARGLRSAPGRGFLEGAPIQIATASADPAAASQAELIRRLGEELGATPGQRPPPIELLPERIPLDRVDQPDEPLRATLGVAGSDLSPAPVDLRDGHLLIAGPYRSGRSTALLAVATSLSFSTPDRPRWLLAPRGGPLIREDVWDRVASSLPDCEEAIAQLARGDGGPYLVFIDDADELAEGSAAFALEPLIKDRTRDLRFVAAAESQALHRSFGGWLNELRKQKQGLLLDPDLDLDGDLLGVKLPRRQKRSFPPGRGYLVRRGRIELVQIAVG